MLKLAGRFQPVRIAANDYRLVSLTESVRVRLREESHRSNGLLDQVIPLLVAGESVQGILKRVGNSHGEAVRGLLRDLKEQGAIEELLAGRPRLSETESNAYDGQMRFLSHFHPISEDAKSRGPAEVITAEQMQRKARDATVMLLGLGKLGAMLAMDLAAMGVGRLIGADAGRVTHRDVVATAYRPDQIGTSREIAMQSQMEQYEGLVSFRPAGFGSEADLDDSLKNGIDLLVLCEDTLRPKRQGEINLLCLRRRVRWTSIRSQGFRIELGPTVVPFETACFRCYELRRLGNTAGDEDQWLAHYDGTLGGVPPAELNITIGDQLLGVEVLKVLTGFTTPLTYGRVLSFDLLSFEIKAHPVLRVPRCAACGRRARGRPSVNTWILDETSDDLGS